jgi:hypothetical protein
MTTRAARLLFLLLALLALSSVAPGATRADGASAPTGLHPFLLRVDEPSSDVFSRTPSFAWNPVPGAVRYEFQLSTSDVFRENGIVFSDTSLTSPVAAPALTLPWITGAPHALYARVRAVLLDATTPWSDSFGFDMQPPAAPAPLPSYPGLLRWTPVDGAVGYQIWFVDIPKFVSVTTNVADERDFYTFHQAASWLGQVRWRVRAIRNDFNTRANGLPAVTHGAWSPVYSSVNPPFAVGPLKPQATVSDVVSTGTSSSPAHRLMPAFVFGGSQSFAGASAELYRVYVFTDRGCLNRVFASAIVGSPAYAPRSYGPLALPQSTSAIATARSAYLPDGDEGPSFTFDRERVTGNESLPPVTPTVGLPAGAAKADATPPASAPAAGAPTAGAPTAGSTAGGGLVQLLQSSGTMGPPIDLWDTDWSSGGGYYWTVVPVEAKLPAALSTSVAGAGSAGAAVTLPVANATGFAVGDTISIGNPGNVETATITSVSGSTIGVGAALKLGHGAGEPVTRTSGSIQYTDLELAQDACAGGRVQRFGKESEPALTAGGEPFASGLSPDGELASATDKAAFYGAPLVAWTTALGAEAYAVQWSKTRQPFVPETDPATGALGMMTLNTSAILPLTPGTWYYRVRGYDYSLPTGAQAMSWSDPQAIVATEPIFTIVRDAASAGTKAFRVPAGGFSISVPSTWDGVSRSTAGAALKSKPRLVARLGPKLKDLASGTSALRFVAYDPSGASISTTLSVQASADQGSYAHSAWVKKVIAEANGLKNRVGPVRCAGISLPAGAGVRCALTARAQGGGAESAVLYVLQHRNATYSLTFTSSPGAGAAKARLFAASARSFRFTL